MGLFRQLIEISIEEYGHVMPEFGRFRQTMLINYLSQLNNKNQNANAPKQSPYNPDNHLNSNL